MYKGMSQDVFDKYCQKIQDKINGGRVEQLKYYPAYIAKYKDKK